MPSFEAFSPWMPLCAQDCLCPSIFRGVVERTACAADSEGERFRDIEQDGRSIKKTPMGGELVIKQQSEFETTRDNAAVTRSDSKKHA